MLQVNASVELHVLDGPARGRYRTRAEEIGPESVKVSLPTVNGVPLGVLAGDPVRCYITSGRTMYAFESEVLGREFHPLPCVVLAPPREFKRVQRRDFVRLDLNIPVRYAKVELQPGAGPEQAPALARTRTVDLSGGGAAIYLPTREEVGSLFHLYLQVPGGQVSATAEVVRIIRHDPEQGFLTAVRYVDISERDRDRIIRHIFQEQRERRRKGLL